MNVLHRAADYWWLFAVPLVVLAFVAAAYVINPIEQLEDHVAEPAAKSLGIIYPTCPGGWDNESFDETHVQVLSCSRDVGGITWLVVLNPEDGTFSHGFPLDIEGAEFVFDEEAVPEWPR